MTVYEYAKEHNLLGDEITCWDTVYDIEFYAYPDDEVDESDDFEVASQELWKLLEVRESLYDNPEYRDALITDVTGLIKKYQASLSESGLFYNSSVGAIVNSFHSVVSGYVSEEWMRAFVNILKGAVE